LIFFDIKSNTIIEYNGSIYHAPEILSETERANWKNKYGLSWNEVYNKDKQKIEAAKSAGYNIVVVWDYEIRSKTKLKEKIKELVNILGRSDES
jgi:G:T-mismatch repair DNA endonuclease (very short patch repair protein)